MQFLADCDEDKSFFVSDGRRLKNLDDEVIIFMVQGQHPMKRIAQHLLQLEKGETSYDFKPLAELMQRVFTMNYDYWLSEKDPLAWFTAECGDICRTGRIGGAGGVADFLA